MSTQDLFKGDYYHVKEHEVHSGVVTYDLCRKNGTTVDTFSNLTIANNMALIVERKAKERAGLSDSSEQVVRLICCHTCDHDYSGWEEGVDEFSGCSYGTVVCVKCGRRAIDDAYRM